MGIESVLSEHRTFHPDQAFVENANVSGMAAYEKLCAAANDNYEKFWADLARELIIWKKPFTKTLNDSNAPFYKWFEDGELNVSYNCLDKHLGTQIELLFIYPWALKRLFQCLLVQELDSRIP